MSPSFIPSHAEDTGPGRDPASVDLLLVLDRSASMAGDRLSAMVQGVHKLLDLLPDGTRAGLVTFGPTASAAVQLTRDFRLIRKALRHLRPQGHTDYAAAFRTAAALFNGESLRRKVVVLCTDGETDRGRDTPSAVHLLRKQGVEVFSIGLTASAPLLTSFSGTPAKSHVLTAPCPGDLSPLFTAVGTLIFGEACSRPAVPAPPEKPVCPGRPAVPAKPECCPLPECCKPCCCPLPACKTCGVIHLPPAGLTDQGRIVYLNVTLKDVCPGRRIALAVILTEAVGDLEETRGMRCLTVPAQPGEGCRDVTLKCIPFVVPEDLCDYCDCCDCCDCCNCCQHSLCRERNFRARVIANYIDTDTVTCCGLTARL